MQIAAISDIHGLDDVRNLEINCDVLCICGDIVPVPIQRDNKHSLNWWNKTFIPWINNLKCERVIVTPGNHDFFLEDLFIDTERFNKFVAKNNELTNFKLIVLINSAYTYKGIKFYGCPYIRPIGWGKWAFEDAIVEFEEDIKDMWYYSYDNVDILLTHDNPYHNNYLANNWFAKYKYWFYGHWHEGEDNPEQNKYNVSILTNGYNLKKNYKVTIVELEDEKNED